MSSKNDSETEVSLKLSVENLSISGTINPETGSSDLKTDFGAISWEKKENGEIVTSGSIDSGSTTMKPDKPKRARARADGKLSNRETEIVALLADGLTCRAIAEKLGISAKTVDTHKTNLMKKLGVHNRVELVKWAIREKVVKA